MGTPDGGTALSASSPVRASRQAVRRPASADESLELLGTKVTKDAVTADFRVLDYVTTPDASVSTKASFAIQDGVPGLQARGQARQLVLAERPAGTPAGRSVGAV